MALDTIQSGVDWILGVTPDPIITVLAVTLLGLWLYAIVHFLANEYEDIRLKGLWAIIVFVVPFGFMFYLTSNLDWKE